MKFWTIFLFVFQLTFGQDSITFLNKIPLLKNGFYLHDEHHFQNSARLIDSELLKFYVLHRNVKNVFIEMGHSTAYLMNQYLESGENKWLCRLLHAKVGENFVHFVKEARKLNLQKKFKFYGLDVYSFHSDWNYTIDHILNKYVDSLPEFTYFTKEIKPMIVYYESLNLNNFKTLEDSIVSPNKCYSLHERFNVFFNQKKKYLKNKMNEQDFKTIEYILFSEVARSLEEERTLETNNQWLDNVHYAMENLIQNNDNCFAQVGQAHTMNYQGSFSRILNDLDSSFFKNNVFLCHSDYVNSYQRMYNEPSDYKTTNNFTHQYKKYKIERKFRRFHKKAKTNSKYEFIPIGRYKRFKHAGILLIRYDTPADSRLKFCGDGGW
ncbi:MAG: hypothetical protein N4A45_09815 [Flavobacteriales bacterium]|jgi:hypothetical protein|nr:hypothetical protein [Flavobacteriales bacterium]